ncbi:MAG: polysaccharide biosynthesis/export family protein [Zavarzinella sp.]
MAGKILFRRTLVYCSSLALCVLNVGCYTAPKLGNPAENPAPYTMDRELNQAFYADQALDQQLPRELQMVTMPEYIIEPPDILRIELTNVQPLPNYRLDVGDTIGISIIYPGLTEPVSGDLPIGPDGTVNLGPTFGGTIKLVGLTTDEARVAIEKQAIEYKVREPKASIQLLQSRSLPALRGEYLVRQDGTVGLGIYGSVRLVGVPLAQANIVIQDFLKKSMNNPSVTVDIAAYNSKKFYVIYDGGGRGQQVVPLPITGKDTVLDAVAQLNGLSPVSSTNHMWLARPAPAATGKELIMPIDWNSVTQHGSTKTNYQILPGDRLYVKAQPMITFDNYLSMFLSPIERALGVTLLGQSTIQSIKNPNLIGGGVGGGAP